MTQICSVLVSCRKQGELGSVVSCVMGEQAIGRRDCMCQASAERCMASPAAQEAKNLRAPEKWSIAFHQLNVLIIPHGFDIAIVATARLGPAEKWLAPLLATLTQ